VDVPVLGIVPVTVNDWLTSKADALGEGASGGTSAEFTVTLAEAVEVFGTGGEPLSVTFSSKL
jgi:hypothetical protein